MTGAGQLDTDEVARRLRPVRRHARIPVGVGFGIRDADSAARVARHADAVVIGSRLIQIIEEASLSDGPQAAIGAAAPTAGPGAPGHRTHQKTRLTMSWIEKILPPRINRSGDSAYTRVPEGLWVKCPSCESVLYKEDLKPTLNVCPKCDHHMRIGARARIDALLDPEGRVEIGANTRPMDPLKFRDSRKYPERVTEAVKQTGETEAMVVMSGIMLAVPVVLACFEFAFMGGSMGSVVGERFARGVQEAIKNRGRRSSACPPPAARAHAGKPVFSDADGQDQRHAAPAVRRRPAVH